MSRRMTIVLPDATAEAIEEVADEFGLSYSAICRDLMHKSLGDKTAPAVEDAIADDTLRLARKEARNESMRRRQQEREKRASFDDRIIGFFRARLEGDAAYPIEEMEGADGLAEGYREDARIWFDDEEKIGEKIEKVDRWLAVYRAGVWAREHAEARTTTLSPDEVDGGYWTLAEDIFSLREQIGEVIEEIEHVADETTAWDSAAVVESIAGKFGVCEAAVKLVVDGLTADGADRQEMLSIGGEAVRDRSDLELGTGEPETTGPAPITEGDRVNLPNGRPPETPETVEADGGQAGE